MATDSIEGRICCPACYSRTGRLLILSNYSASRLQLCASALLLTELGSALLPPPPKNEALEASFAGSFLSFVKSLTPNNNPQKDSITPFWQTYAPGNTEMVFNLTDTGDAVVDPVATDSSLLERCAFWQSIGPSTAQ